MYYCRKKYHMLRGGKLMIPSDYRLSSYEVVDGGGGRD